MPLLWSCVCFRLTGTKFGCGWRNVRLHRARDANRALLRDAAVCRRRKSITNDRRSIARRQSSGATAWAELDVVAMRLLFSRDISCPPSRCSLQPKPTDADIDAALTGNICAAHLSSACVRIHRAASSNESRRQRSRRAFSKLITLSAVWFIAFVSRPGRLSSRSPTGRQASPPNAFCHRQRRQDHRPARTFRRCQGVWNHSSDCPRAHATGARSRSSMRRQRRVRAHVIGCR